MPGIMFQDVVCSARTIQPQVVHRSSFISRSHTSVLAVLVVVPLIATNDVAETARHHGVRDAIRSCRSNGAAARAVAKRHPPPTATPVALQSSHRTRSALRPA